MDNITRTDLKQIYYLNNEYGMWQERLEALEQKRSSLRSASDMEQSGVHSNNTTDAVGNLAVNIAETKEIMKGIMAKIHYQQKRMLKHIATVDDSQLRQILQYRCVDCMSWIQVGNRMNITADAARMIFARAYPK